MVSRAEEEDARSQGLGARILRVQGPQVWTRFTLWVWSLGVGGVKNRGWRLERGAPARLAIGTVP